MSGMSADGLDLALVRVAEAAGRLEIVLGAHTTAAYPPDLTTRIHAAVEGTTRDVCTLSFELAECWAATVLAFLSEHGVEPRDVDVLGSHGQTLDHHPRGSGTLPSTLQVGDGDVLAHRTGILTVSDFRCRDVAAGGEGAPLVPLADWLLHARPGVVTACQNLGSIANVTVVTERLEEIRGFDTGPANALIDAFARRASGDAGAIDLDGRISAEGRVDETVLAALYRESGAFLRRPPPKSAGYVDFGPALAGRISSAHSSTAPEDLVRTAVEFTASTLAEAYERWVVHRYGRIDRVHVTGGGAHNPTLMGRLRERLGRLGLTVEVPGAAWIDAKEAVAFALLADRTVHGRPGNVPGATGAREAVVLGKISL